MIRCYFLFLIFASWQLAFGSICGADDSPLFPQSILETGEGPHAIVCADFNNDGLDDLATANFRNTTILFGLGDKQFSDPVILSDARASEVIENDFNSDGNVDLLIAEIDEDRIVTCLGDGQGNFSQVWIDIPLVHHDSMGVITADFNDDQILDVALTNAFLDNITVMIGIGDGTFQILADYEIDHFPTNIFAADLNGDAVLDLTVSQGGGSNAFSVLMGIGDGTFSQAESYPTLFSALDLVVADFNSDGIPDVVVPPSICFGIGDGSFGPPEYVASPSWFVETLDFDQNGTSDLVLSPGYSNELWVLSGNGDGTFDTLHTGQVGYAPNDAIFADFDKDGDTDIAVVNTTSDAITIVERLDDESLSFYPTIPAENNPYDIVSDDLDMDGNLDIVVANHFADSVSVFLGNGDGSFRSHTNYTVNANSPRDLVLADLNNDGIKDIATANVYSDVSVLLGEVDGTFGTAQTYRGPQGMSYIAAGDDINGDGFADIVGTSGREVFVLPGRGDGTFGDFNLIHLSGSGGNGDVRVTDMNNDGIPDVVYCKSLGGLAGDIRSLIANGDGSFQPPVISPSVDFDPNSFALSDFNNDGLLDVFVGGMFPHGNTTAIFIGSGSGHFEPPFIIEPDQSPHDTTIGDFNRDGNMDVASVDFFENMLSVQIGNGDGTFGERELFQVGHRPRSLAVGDLNNDGYPDVVVANSSGDDLTILLNQTLNNVIIGDVNRDCLLNLLDIAPFVELLSNGGFQAEADINGDLVVDLLDVAPFIELLIDN